MRLGYQGSPQGTFVQLRRACVSSKAPVRPHLACLCSASRSSNESPKSDSDRRDGAGTTPTPTQWSQQRAFRRQARALLTNRQHSSVSTAAAVMPGRTSNTMTTTSNNGASSGSATLVTTVESPAPTPGANRPSHHRALVLDSGFRPINVVPWSRAVMLDVNAKADVLEYYSPPACAYSGRGEHLLPAVVVINRSVNLSELVARVSCTRRNIMIRDKFQCQYCGARRDLTLDHVVPVSRGGRDTWTNLVTACGPCNQRKANHLGWRPRTQPREPRPWEVGVVVGLSSSELDQAPEEWGPYIQQFCERQRQIRSDLKAAGICPGNDEDDDEEEEYTSGWS